MITTLIRLDGEIENWESNRSSSRDKYERGGVPGCILNPNFTYYIYAPIISMTKEYGGLITLSIGS